MVRNGCSKALTPKRPFKPYLPIDKSASHCGRGVGVVVYCEEVGGERAPRHTLHATRSFCCSFILLQAS